MNLAVSNTRTLRLVKQHSLATIGALGVVAAVLAGGLVAVNESSSGGTAPAVQKTDLTRFRYSTDDWKTVYYIVPTQELADQIMLAEAEMQNVIVGNQGELPHRTIRAIVTDTPEQEALVSSMMAEASTETTSFVDLRYPPIPPITSGDGPAGVDGSTQLSTPASLYQPYPCSEPDDTIKAFEASVLAGICN